MVLKNRASVVVLVTFLCFFSCPLGSFGTSNDEQFKYLKIPAAEFVSSVKSTLDIVQQVMSLVSGFGNAFGDVRVSNAISDCLELLDLSTDQLTDTLSVSQNPKNGMFSSSFSFLLAKSTHFCQESLAFCCLDLVGLYSCIIT